MTNQWNTTLYTGITNDITRRALEHKHAADDTFTGKYKLTKLVYVEQYSDATLAIAREKQIKAGSRKKKLSLIKSMNPECIDLMGEVGHEIATVSLRLPSQ